MGNSFDFVRKLVEAERYRDYKKEYWGGADVIIATPEKLEKIDSVSDSNRTLRERLLLDYPSIRLVETEYARGVIWLIKTLAPYVEYDYLSKYDYFKQVADSVDNHKDDAKKRQDENEKWLLLEIIQDLDNGKIKWEKTIYEEQIERLNWKEWYNYGVEHNDPFFVKFMALWIYFNHLYRRFPGKYVDKRGEEREGAEYAKIIEWCNEQRKRFKTKYEMVFNSPFIKIFLDDKVIDVKSNYQNRETFEALKDDKDIYKRTNALFQTMYQVRCNLFHGDKRFNDPRDIELVRCAGEILEIYLKDLR